MKIRNCLAIACLTAASSGCIDPANIFASDLLEALGAVPSAAGVPGEAPALVIGVRNDTSRLLEFQISFRGPSGEVEMFSGQSDPSSTGEPIRFSRSVFCPVTEVTLGDVSNLSATGAVIRQGTSTADPLIQVEPFGILLQDGVQYNCGDRITFIVAPSSATPSTYQVFAQIETATTP